MDRVVDDVTMQRVNIKEGWLIEQFARYVLGRALGPPDPLLLSVPVGNDEYGTLDIVVLQADFADALKRWDSLVAQKNLQYEDAWQKDGPVTALADLKDKLYRLSSATRSEAVISWDPDKRRSTLFDILVRTIMVLAWEEKQWQDDDDDRIK